jgi:hypothetical protein
MGDIESAEGAEEVGVILQDSFDCDRHVRGGITGGDVAGGDVAGGTSPVVGTPVMVSPVVENHRLAVGNPHSGFSRSSHRIQSYSK